MTKAQKTLNEVQNILKEHEASDELTLAIIKLLAPKRGEGSLTNTPLTDEDGNITHYWCRLHERYELVENMVMSNGVSKGMSKAALSAWSKRNSAIKKLESESVQALMDGDFEVAQAKAQEVKEAKKTLNDPASYDYEEDWKNYEANKTK